MSHHTCLVEQLELKYMNYIQHLLLQKTKILVKMQRDFYKELHEVDALSTTTKTHVHINNNGPYISRQVECLDLNCNNIRSHTNAPSSYPEGNQIASIETRSHDSNTSQIGGFDDTFNAHQFATKETNTTTNQHNFNPFGNPSGIPLQPMRIAGTSSQHEELQDDDPKSGIVSDTCNASEKGLFKSKCPYATCMNKTYVSESKWKAHFRTHIGESPYKCHYVGCGKIFKHIHKLIDHTGIHSKPFKCNHPGCGKAFARKYILTQHMNIHTGEKPYQCNVCWKRFATTSGRRQHVKHCQ
eukprot:457571_1